MTRRGPIDGGLFLTLAISIAGLAWRPLRAVDPVCPLAVEVETVRRINEARAAAGLRAIALDMRLVASGRLHSADMATNGFFSHTGSNGSVFSDRIRAQGYPSPYGETIAGGYSSADAVVRAWLNSPPHRAVLFSAVPTHVGVGFHYDRDSDYLYYWTANFGLSTAAPVPQPAACGGGGTSRFRRGDANGDARVDIGDVSSALGYLFGRVGTNCLDALDINNDGGADLADGIFLLHYLFSGGPAPAAPFPACGADQGVAMGCASYSSC